MLGGNYCRAVLELDSCLDVVQWRLFRERESLAVILLGLVGEFGGEWEDIVGPACPWSVTWLPAGCLLEQRAFRVTFFLILH